MDVHSKFRDEVRNMETADIMLILEDQLDLYSEEEIKVLKDELSARAPSKSEIEASKQRIATQYEDYFEDYLVEEQKQKELREFERERKELQELHEMKASKIKELKKSGYDSYFEYMYLTAFDDSSRPSIDRMIEKMNMLALEGWRLKATFVNDLGRKTAQPGIGGALSVPSGPAEKTVFILEREIKIASDALKD